MYSQLQNLYPILLSDTIVYDRPMMLYIGTGGSLRVLTPGGDDVTLRNVPDGSTLPILVSKVFATGSTVGNVLATQFDGDVLSYFSTLPSWVLQEYSLAFDAEGAEELGDYEAGTLYFRDSNFNRVPATFSRTTTATRVDENGLIEKGRENLLLQSNQFDTNWFINGTGTLTSGQAGYDGSNDAWLLTKSAASTYLSQSTSLSGISTFSIYAKAGTNTHLAFWIRNANMGKFFNLSNGTIGSDYVGTPIDAKIESVGNGWYRCSITTDDATNNCRIYPADADGDVSGTSGSIYIQDAQLEVGLVATDYIETTTTTAVSGITEDLPRIDYSGGASCPALLLEPQRTNLVTQSEYLNGIVWNGKIGTSFDTNTTTSPEGLDNASLLKEDSSNGSHFAYKDFSLTSGSTYTISIFAKSNGANRNLRFGDGGVGWSSGFNGVFDLTAGTATDGTIEPMGSGWYRCSVTGTTNATTCRLIIYSTLNTATSYQGDGVSGVYLYGFQIEEGSYATSYIPTYGSIVTRNADDLVLLNVGSKINSPNTTIYLENYVAVSNRIRYDITNANGANVDRFQIHSREVASGINTAIVDGAVVQAVLSDTNYSNEQYLKIIGKTDGVNLSLFHSGVKYGEAATASVPIFDRINIRPDALFKAELRQFIIFPTALTDSECEQLTS